MAKYNFLNKREPMDRALSDFSATLWMAAVKARQARGKIFHSLSNRMVSTNLPNS